MVRRKYYKKKRYYKIKQEIDPITGLIVGGILFSYMTYNFFIKPNLDNIILFLFIFTPILIIVIGLIFFYKYKRKKEEKQKRIANIPNLLLELENKIKNFKPLKHYNKEEPYQIELAGFLKNTYKSLNIEVSKNYTRPDIVIDNIAIEIKGPTTMNELKTIPHKIITYLKEWDYLFIILFNIKIVGGQEKSQEIYNNWKNSILETFENKKNKIFIIEI